MESYVYLPLCEELNFVPKEKYTHAPEILAHSRAIGEKFNLYDYACFQTEVEGMRWSEEVQRWTVTTNRGDRMTAKYVCMANGPLNRPKLPGIKGIDRIRYTTSHPAEFTDSLVEVYKTVPKLVSHLHLPIQSGSNKILKLISLY